MSTYSDQQEILEGRLASLSKYLSVLQFHQYTPPHPSGRAGRRTTANGVTTTHPTNGHEENLSVNTNGVGGGSGFSFASINRSESGRNPDNDFEWVNIPQTPIPHLSLPFVFPGIHEASSKIKMLERLLEEERSKKELVLEDLVRLREDWEALRAKRV